jgi:26S proteasome regulatory subunit N6
MSGILSAEEADHKTSYSYFFEATEAYAQDGTQPEETTQCLKYMLLAKVMHQCPEEVESIANSKMSISKSPIDIEAIMAIARAAKARSLKEFEEAKVAPCPHFSLHIPSFLPSHCFLPSHSSLHSPSFIT